MAVSISIVIVNYNSGDYLRQCVDSLEKQTFQDFEVIVVDNASRDQSLECISDKPWIQVIRSPLNLGFAGGQNLGMKKARGQFLMPLNFDIYLMPDFLKAALEALDANPKAGTLSGKLLRMGPDGERTDEFDNAGLLLSLDRKPVHRGIGEQDQGQYQQRDLVFGAMGAAAIFRREMLADIAYQGQYFDESYFTWWEDVDLDWRGRLRGWECLYIPEAVAYHVGDPQKNKITSFAARHSIRNRWQMIGSNECLHCLVSNLPRLLVEEFKLLRHVVKYHHVRAYLTALAEFMLRLPAVLSKRRWVRRRAVISCLPNYPLPLQTTGG